MSQLFAPLLQIRHTDEDARRRGQNVIVLALVLIGLAMMSLAPMSGMAEPWRFLLPNAVAIALHVAAIGLARQGRVLLGASVNVLAAALSLFVGILTLPNTGLLPFFLIMPVLLAGATMRAGATWLVFLAVFALLAVFSGAPGSSTITLSREEVATTAGVLLFFAAVISAVSARSAARTLQVAQQSRVEAERVAVALEQTNASLEQRVVERTAELSAALAASEQQAQQLQEALESQRQLDALLAEVSLPVIPVREDVLVAPLVGALDSARAQQLLCRVLEQIEAEHASVVILDVTGVPVVDSQVGQALLQTAAAARLLGARPMLAGIRPEVAQALVGLGVDLNLLETCASLQQGLERISARQHGGTTAAPV